MQISLKVFLALCLVSNLASGLPRLTPVGRWKLFHSDGTPLYVQVYANGKATSSWQGQHGRWSVKNGKLLLEWSDGWKDLIVPTADGYQKSGYAPEADISKPASNHTKAYQLPSAGKKRS